MTSLPNPHSKPLDRQNYADFDIEEILRKKFQVFSPKYDGIWARVEIADSLCQIFSRTGQLKETFGVPTDMKSVTLIGEFMYGSQWSKKEGREGKIFLFDIIVEDDVALWLQPYSTRYRALLNNFNLFGPRFEIIPVYKGERLKDWWDHNALTREYEGVVCRDWSDTWQHSPARVKLDVEDDFVIIGFLPGKNRLDGTLGSLVLGQYNEAGQLVEVMDCGGGISDELRDEIWSNRPAFFNRVVTCTGKGRFDSGALRHPNFVRFHPDKPAHLCLLKNK